MKTTTAIIPPPLLFATPPVQPLALKLAGVPLRVPGSTPTRWWIMLGVILLTVGLFAWADTATGTILSNTGTGPVSCFVHRNMQATNYVYLSDATMLIPPGQGVGEMFSGGDFFVKDAGAGATTIGMKAFANTTNGTVSFAAAGATVAGSVETKWYAMTINATGELVKISSTPLG